VRCWGGLTFPCVACIGPYQRSDPPDNRPTKKEVKQADGRSIAVFSGVGQACWYEVKDQYNDQRYE